MEIIFLIVLLRLIVPISILRWPFWGGVAATAADALDVVIMDALRGPGFGTTYAQLDKVLDTYYISMIALVTTKWEPLAKWTTISLFFYRFIGVILFESTGTRVFLFFFPNLVEFFFLFWAARNVYFPRFRLTPKRLAVVLLLLLIPKMAQEYLLHYIQAKPWEWMKENLFWWLFS